MRQCRDGKGEKCHNEATVRLIAPDGKAVPGSAMCLDHALEVMSEYYQKLGETWTIETLD